MLVYGSQDKKSKFFSIRRLNFEKQLILKKAFRGIISDIISDISGKHQLCQNPQYNQYYKPIMYECNGDRAKRNYVGLQRY